MSHDEDKAEMGINHLQMIEAKMNGRSDALMKVKEHCKKFGFIAGKLKSAVT
tara:strand:- start:336 stop:491 length:156 start_codon:yes stop_codon:yes gene_type:complete